MRRWADSERKSGRERESPHEGWMSVQMCWHSAGVGCVRWREGELDGGKSVFAAVSVFVSDVGNVDGMARTRLRVGTRESRYSRTMLSLSHGL